MDDARSSNKSTLIDALPNASSLDMHECIVLIKQITNLLNTAASETAPPGVSTADIQRRMELLQSILETMKEQVATMRATRRLKEQQHLTKVHRQRMKMQEEARKKSAVMEKYKTEQEQQMRDSRDLYYKSQCQGFSQKVSQCKAHNGEALLEIIAKAQENEDKQDRRLERLRRERAMKQIALQKKQAENFERTRSVNCRRLTEDALNQLKRQQEAEARAREVEAKLFAVRKSRILAVHAKGCSKSAARASTESRRVGSKISSKNYEQLLKELDTKTRQQQERYAEQREAYLEYQNMRACAAANKHLQQKNNALRLLEEKIDRNDKLIERLNEKMITSRQIKEAHNARWKKSRDATNADIERHKCRADRIELERQCNILHKSFRRWNHRGACMMERLRKAFDADGSEFNGENYWNVPDHVTELQPRQPPVCIPDSSKDVA